MVERQTEHSVTALPTSKHAKLCYLLDHWDDIHDPNSASPAGRPGSGTNTPHLAAMSRHPSVVELTRCLRVLKLENKLQHDHLKAYHGAEWKIRTRLSTRKRKGGKLETITLRDRVKRPPAWVAMGYVRAGEFRLVELFVGPVFIPTELWDALTLDSAAIEAKERLRAGRRMAA